MLRRRAGGREVDADTDTDRDEEDDDIEGMAAEEDGAAVVVVDLGPRVEAPRRLLV